MLEMLHWIINTPGIGGLAAMSVAATALIIFVLSLLWLRRGTPMDATSETASEDQVIENTERSDVK